MLIFFFFSKSLTNVIQNVEIKQDGEDLFKEDGMPTKSFPNHWKGENGLYSVGFASQGLFGIARDAENVSNHIHGVVTGKH